MLQQFLSDLRKSCEDRHIPLISVQTQDFLISWLERNQPKRVLEIWSAVWFSSIIISKTIQQRWGTLTSFEISYPAYLEALKILKKLIWIMLFSILLILMKSHLKSSFLRNLMQRLLMLRRANIEIICRKFDYILHQKIRFYLMMSSNIKTNFRDYINSLKKCKLIMRFLILSQEMVLC